METTLGVVPAPRQAPSEDREEVERALWELLAEVDPGYQWRGEPCRMLTCPRDHQQLAEWLRQRDDVETVVMVLSEGWWRARIRSRSFVSLGYGVSRSPEAALGVAAVRFVLEVIKARREEGSG